jgi:histidyl-tRNA synthetase
MFEMRLGVEWSRELSNGARFYTQTVYEAQYWQSAQLFNGAGGMDVGFTGVAFNIGLAR